MSHPQLLTVCHLPARERWRLWTRRRGPGPSVRATNCPWLRKRVREGLLAARGATRSRRPWGARGRTSMDRRNLEAKHSVSLSGHCKAARLAGPYRFLRGSRRPSNSRKLGRGPPNWKVSWVILRCRGDMQAGSCLGWRLRREAWRKGTDGSPCLGCPLPTRLSRGTPCLTLRATARSPRALWPEALGSGTRAQPVLTLVLPRFCCRSNTRCGPWSLGECGRQSAAGRTQRASPPCPPLTAARRHC